MQSTLAKRKRRIFLIAAAGILLVVLVVSFLKNFVPTFSKQYLTKYPDSVWVCETEGYKITIRTDKHQFEYESSEETVVGDVRFGPGSRISFHVLNDRGNEYYFKGYGSFQNSETEYVVKVSVGNSLVAAGETLVFIRQ